MCEFQYEYASIHIQHMQCIYGILMRVAFVKLRSSNELIYS